MNKIGKALQACDDFTPGDFLDLAYACLDQAGLSVSYDGEDMLVVKVVDEIIPPEAE